MPFHFSLALLFSFVTLKVESTSYSELGPLTRINEGIADGDKMTFLLPKEYQSTASPSTASSSTSSPSTVSSSTAPSSATSTPGNPVTAPPDLPLPSTMGGSGVPHVPGGGNQINFSSLPNPIQGLIGAIQLAQSVTRETIDQFSRLVNQINQNAMRIISG